MVLFTECFSLLSQRRAQRDEFFALPPLQPASQCISMQRLKAKGEEIVEKNCNQWKVTLRNFLFLLFNRAIVASEKLFSIVQWLRVLLQACFYPSASRPLPDDDDYNNILNEKGAIIELKYTFN